MPLFSCFNPSCGRGFNTRFGMNQHMRQFDTCAKYALATIMYASNGSDSEIDSISLEVEGNVPNNNNNDGDDNSNDHKRQRIGELRNDSEMLEDGSFPISRENLIDMMTPKDLPPRINFQFSLLCLLSHSSIPLYIYSEVIRMILSLIHI